MTPTLRRTVRATRAFVDRTRVDRTRAHDTRADRTHAQLMQALVGVLFVGAIVLLSLPVARTATATFGWMPLWIVGMPLASLGALRLRQAVARDGLPTRARGELAAQRRCRMPAVMAVRRRDAAVVPMAGRSRAA